MGSIVLTLCTFIPIITAVILYKVNLLNEIADIILLIGLAAGIYWLIYTGALSIYVVKKFIEIGDCKIFFVKVRDSLWN